MFEGLSRDLGNFTFKFQQDNISMDTWGQGLNFNGLPVFYALSFSAARTTGYSCHSFRKSD